MSFGTYARKVRDPALPYGRRVKALAGCVQHYHPIGYRPTFGFLIRLAGPVRCDEPSLLRALDVLSASRDLWLADLRGYADRRLAAKRLGNRSPAPAEPNPNRPAHWHGDVQQAALFTLEFIRVGPADHPEVRKLAFRALKSGGRLTPTESGRLTELRERIERVRGESVWPGSDLVDYHKALSALWILKQIADAQLPPG